MIDLNNFRQWLLDNKEYTNRTVGNIVCRFKRADSMLSWFDDSVYLFRLEQLDVFKNLSITVRSQIRKAVKLYSEFIENGK